MKFSQELVERYKKCMLQDYNQVVTDEEAQQHLTSHSGLFFSFSKEQPLNP
jgi:hypothetical protein